MTYGIQELDQAYADGMEDLGQKIIELLDESMAADEELHPEELISFIEDELSFDPGGVDVPDDHDLLIEYFIDKFKALKEAKS